jgi:phytoene synthase
VAPTPAALLEPGNHPAVFQVVQIQLQLAEAYYASARRGLRALPFRSALAIAAARGVYREIGRRILRKGPEALQARMSVPKLVLAGLIGRGVLVALLSRLERPLRPAARPALWSRI